MIKKIDLEKLNTYIDKGLIKQRWNNEHTLFTINYTEACTYENAWDEYTLMARGSTWDKDGNLVMPCMHKFFNFYQYKTEDQKRIANWMTNKKGFITSVKYDGCLCALYPYEGRLVITSKSTFDNYVVEEVKKIIKDKVYVNNLEDISTGLVCECISPATRQLVDYGDAEQLKVITTYNLETLEENDFNTTLEICKDLGLSMVEEVDMTYEQLQDWCKTHDFTEEGFVVRNIDTNERCKFKSEDYLRVAAIKSYLDLKHLVNVAISYLDTNKNNKDADWKEHLHQMIQNMPDELYKLGDQFVLDLSTRFEYTFDNVFAQMQKVKDLTDKELGLKNDDRELCKVKSLVFSLRNDKDITLPVMKNVKEQIVKEEKENGSIYLNNIKGEE